MYTRREDLGDFWETIQKGIGTLTDAASKILPGVAQIQAARRGVSPVGGSGLLPGGGFFPSTYPGAYPSLPGMQQPPQIIDYSAMQTQTPGWVIPALAVGGGFLLIRMLKK